MSSFPASRRHGHLTIHLAMKNIKEQVMHNAAAIVTMAPWFRSLTTVLGWTVAVDVSPLMACAGLLSCTPRISRQAFAFVLPAGVGRTV
jgi:hypothetical protein